MKKVTALIIHHNTNQGTAKLVKQTKMLQVLVAGPPTE